MTHLIWIRHRFKALGTLALLLTVALFLQPAAQSHAATTSSEDAMPTILMTGANRGIGLEFARQYAAKGWNVIATCRNPDSADELKAIAAQFDTLSIEPLDITNVDQIAALKEKYQDVAFDILLNNAALLGSRKAQAFGQLDFDLFQSILDINITGTMRVTEAFVDNARASSTKKIITLGSAAGSIQMMGNTPDYYPYRASKAALHLMTNALSHELKAEGIRVGLINPGLVDTRGLADLKPGDDIPEDFTLIMPLVWDGIIELDTTEESVAKMINLIDTLSEEQSGAFLNADGTPLPW